MGKRLNDILNYNSDNRKFRPNWENLFSQLGKLYSLTGAQNLRSKAIFRTLLVALMMVCNFVGAWAQITPTTDTNNPVYYLLQSVQNPAFYMKPNGTKVTTMNSLTDNMKWFFMDAGDDYYYICRKNGDNIQYMYFSGPDFINKNNRIWVELKALTAGSEDKYKFSIAENTSIGGFNFIPKGTNSSTPSSLNKQGGNAGENGIQVGSGLQDEASCWNIIALSSHTWTLHPQCFTVSDNTNRYFYKIKSQNNSKYYIKPGDTYVGTSNSADDDMIWYFEEAESDDFMDYYYIIHANTGQYLRHRADGNNATELADHTGTETGEAEDRFQFVVARGTNSNETVADPKGIVFNIIPKLLIPQPDHKIISLSCYESLGGALKTYNTSNNCRHINHTHWTFESTEYSTVCENPTISFSNETGKVTITTATTRSQIHYTTDGTTTPSASVGTLYEGPFDLTAQTTIKAIVTRPGFTDSEVASATFYKVATPTIQNNGENAISITCETAGTTIYYTTDGTNPTTSSAQYTGPLTEDVSGKTIKAIAVKNGMINSSIGTGNITLKCAKPEFTKTDETHLTISCSFPTSGVNIYYTINGDDPTSSSTLYSGPITVEIGDVIKAIAIATGYENSAVATKKIFNELTPTDGKYLITSQDDFDNFTDMAGTEDGASKHYVLQKDVTAGSEIPLTFTGIFDGGGHTISSPGHALFNNIDGATVKNVILSGVSISGGTNAGAIANVVTGDSRIYNCGVLSGSVGGSDDVGGIVGQLDGSSRVINCYSYANITGGSNVGGIVGNNKVASTASNMKTMVMNCMFYGDITGGSTVSPIYGGLNINNLHGGLNTFNYYAYDNLKTTAISTDKYNCALGVEDRFLKRIEFYRQLLNSNRRLAAKYASKEGATVNASDMMKWVLETADRNLDHAPYPYPILKAQTKYPSIVNYDTRNLADYSEAHRNEGLKTGTLTVNISGVGSGAPTGASITNGSLTLTRTDKDFARFNYNYDKVQLPYYNEVGEGNYTGNKVVTGWKITNMEGGTAGTYSATDAWGGYNFADRNCTNKDLYGTGGSNRVFSQGAYFDVPYGVTGITIEPYWGEAAYVSDEYLDVVFSTAYVAQNVEALGKPFGANGVDVLINGSTQKVYSSINNAVDALSTGGTVYDHAVVLVGNVHLATNPPAANKSFTIMSADLDKDNEPDCSFIFGHNDRQVISPVRFDFINMPGIAMAQKPNGVESFRNVSIFKPKGWFETTNTCLAHFVQFEYDNGGKSAAPVIIQGGLIDQFVSTKVSEPKVTQYIHLGGNAWFKDFGNGTHSDGSYFTPHIPISVTGGEYENFYLSGTYRPDAQVKADNAECYISSGHFGEVAGAAQQQINGNVRWQIYNADIDNFFGGGINFNKPVTGNIQTDIINSHVGTFCGGPKFGDMVTDMTVTTNATGCTFGTYFGAGYGGISYNRVRTQDKSGTNVNFSTWQGDYTGIQGKFSSTNNGVATDFDYEFFVWSTGVVGARFYVKYSSLSMAKTNDVTSTLNNCIINKNFYGGGNLGKVDGTATSVLNGCTVEGNVFGGGYSATTPKVPYRTGGFSTFPKIDVNAGVFDMGEMSDTIHLTLIPGTLSNNTSAINTTDKTIVTNVDLTSLGQVTTTDLTISGSTIVRGQIFDAAGNVTETTGGVFGGGDMSAVHGNTEVKVQGTESTDGVLNVFGGGNTADVGGNTVVNVTGGKVSQSVYGGGKGQTTTVSGNVTVNIGAKAEGTGDLSGTGTVSGNVYGGSALGAVNATKGENYAADATDISATDGKTTTVNIYGGTVSGSVFGGGLGQTSPSSIAAINYADVTVNVEGGSVATAVYGGSNANGVLKGNATVAITGGTVGTVANPITDAVFGGGRGEPTLVEGDVTVNIGTKSNDETPVYTGTATINGNIYGGGALGNVNTSKPASELVFDATKKVDVNLYGGTINGNVFGGGLGQKNGENGAESDILSYVGGDVNVLLDGAKIPGSIFGCNNLNGTPKGHVKVWVKRTVDSDKSSVEALAKTREQRTTYDVAAVYGGGNKADYIPTNALIVLPDKNAEDYDDKLTKLNAARTEVIIEGCEATSINYVYGGGNAAAVPATEVTIKGTYIINNVYGGGNGFGEGNPGANVGSYNNGATNYGTGKAVTKLLGGYINKVYGGSNTKGDIAGGTDVRTKQKDEIVTGDKCNDLNVGNVYGAGSKADVNGDVKITLECMPDDYVDAVYGGAELATVNGDVMLTVTSGKFGRVFGGNNEGGDIHGSITVNVYEDGCKPLKIGELYGGGNRAPYSIYGCTEGTPWTANTSGTLYFDEATKERAAIQVNIYSCTSVGKVYGGGRGATAQVIGNTHVWINPMKGIIDTNGDGIGELQPTIGKVGQVFGGGSAANVKGNTLVDIGTSFAFDALENKINNGALIKTDTDYLNPETDANISITAGVYGGGEAADVDGDATLNIGTKDLPLGVNIGGNIFGGGFGETTHVTGDVTVNIGTNTGTNESPNYVGYANITGDVYGGSAKGKVNSHLVSSVETATEGKETQVNLYGGTISGNLYGGGLGEDNEGTENDHAADVYGPVTVNVEGGKVTNVFGCNNVLGSPKSTATVNINGMAEPVEPATYTITNVYGGGNQAAYTGTGGVSVAMTNGWVNDVFGGGLGTTAIVNEATNVTLSGGSVINDVYGGGSQGNVTGAVTMTLSGGTVGRDVYGGGALAQTNTAYTSGSDPATHVTLSGATITRNLYGGGLGDLSSLGEGHSDVAANVGGPVTVAVTAGSVVNVFGCNNVNGAPQSTVDVEIGAKSGGGDLSGTGIITGNVYGGGNMAEYAGSPTVKLYGGTVNNNVYGGGLGATAKTGGTSIDMEGGTVRNDVYGGGSLADVTGSVSVSVSGGTVTHDVYGGGALASTNTANWNTSTGTWKVESSAPTDYYYPVKHVKKDDTVVTGYYTRSGSEGSYTYTEITAANTKAAEGVTYYKKINLAANIHNVAANGTTYKTTVSLTGGTIGNAYGGGLGRIAKDAVAAVYTAVENGTTLTSGNKYYTSDAGAGEFTSVGTEVANGTNYYELTTPASPAVAAVEAMVYGDVSVTVDGTKFTKETARVDGKAIPTSGRVFGCNNVNGTPKGSVLVWVKQTKRLDGAAGHVKNQFEIQSVYGGGNMSHYVPQTYDPQTEFGQRTQVLIEGCDKTSIEGVYGGGNASDVPFTDVTIEGSFQIGYVFGGGNGGDKINKGSGWEENPGANVTNYTNVLLHGGTIGEAFGGSDSKGSVGGFELTKDAQGICPLLTENIYGASKEADSDGDVTLNLSGCESNVVDKVFGGSYNANVRGNITINITSGIYTTVFGGNDRKGTIGGNITINVEEVDQCNPIIIQNLFGGGSRADYPGTGALTYKGTPNPTGPTEHPDSYTSFTSGNITINVRAATRIDNIFGGCDNAKVTGNTAVNINMVKGSMAGNGFTRPTSYTGDPIPNMHTGEAYAVVSGLTAGVDGVSSYYTRSGNTYTQAEGTAVANTTYYAHLTGISVIDDAIGTIGNVYGGGNQGDVDGDATVNIGTLEDIAFVKTPTHLTANGSGKYDVLGANITGDVFGGGNDGNVTGDATVNIQTADYSTPPTGFVGVNITNGSVYGGGSSANVLGNTNVTMGGGYVYDGVYGGGLHGSVGTFTTSKSVITDEGTDQEFDHSSHADVCIGKPISCASGTGKCTVVVSGGQVGPNEAAEEGKGMLTGVDFGFVFGAGRGDVEDPSGDHDTHFKTYVNETEVIIKNKYADGYEGGVADSLNHVISSPLIMASVYGGGENGRVLGNTLVKIYGGQIGCGVEQFDVSGNPKPYSELQWTTAAAAVDSGDPSEIAAIATDMPECSAWTYASPYEPFDPYSDSYSDPYGPASTNHPTDGKTYYGCVFGGGSGYYPYEKNSGDGYEWLSSAGDVEGSTKVLITGGHILTNVYGANEYTDVKGKATVTMTGGTIGLPRTLAQIAAHPVICYLFGGGKGDQRSHFNDYTNVGSVEVNVSGGIIFGSVFGGAEDGHVLGDVEVNISGTAKIGTWGTSYVDGNVFGGGRGFSGEEITAGAVGGNVAVNINGGTMLGSIYGGGRLASVGIDSTIPINSNYYAQLVDDDPTNSKTYGHVTVNISGGTIGTTTEDGDDHPVGGNVFGGSMGRITLLNGNLNSLWPKLAVVKLTDINISGTADIKNNVYGGSEYGIVRNQTTIDLTGGTVHGNIFGGGYGSDDQRNTTITAGGYNDIPTVYYTFTPMQWTGCVSGNTYVNVSGGKVGKNVYGGGEMASVGLINYNSNEEGTEYNYITKHESLTDGFGLSWPYQFQYITAAPDDDAEIGGGAIGGKATVTVTDGRIEGYVYGGSKGKAMERYTEAFCANVRETEVNINYTTTETTTEGSTNCIKESVYGGGEDGHVEENATVNITGGLIGVSVYGGGKGEGTYRGKLRSTTGSHDWGDETDISSWTAGKVYGNTSVNMTGGHVMVNVYGGGNRASVGKGNYASGTDDYYTAGYGETLTNEKLWTSESGYDPSQSISDTNKPDYAWHFLNSGKATVTITGGTVGTLNGLYSTVDGSTSASMAGMVFGGSRGKAAEDVMEDPRYEYAPDFYLGYVNETHVTIGGDYKCIKECTDKNGKTHTIGEAMSLSQMKSLFNNADIISGDTPSPTYWQTISGDGPRIYSQVFGGGRDGHVRNSTHVVINKGIIGQSYSETEAVGTTTADYQRRHRGNVYGSGSGMGFWDTDTHHGMSSGSVTRNTTVDVYGGTIYGNVYGGGAMSSVGPPLLEEGKDYAPETWSKCTVNIHGGNIGWGQEYESVYQSDYDKYGYGGCVFGAGRGGDYATGESPDNYATTIWNDVNIMGGTIAGNVYGGGQASRVKKNNFVNLLGGTIAHDAYGGGQGTTTIASDVGGDATVELNNNNNGEIATGTVKGCIVDRIFGCNDLNGSPKGRVTVHVYATQHKDKSDIKTKYNKFGNLPEYTITNYNSSFTDRNGYTVDALTSLATTVGANVSAYTTILGGSGSDNDKKAALENMINAIADKKYDVQIVYGGGNLATYDPTDAHLSGANADEVERKEAARTNVIIDGCALTSIKQVYGSGNAASSPATNVRVNGSYEIHEVFGGGNGKDPYQKAADNNNWYGNPGANVGYYDYMEYNTDYTNSEDADEIAEFGNGKSSATAYVPKEKTDAITKEQRLAKYSYGSGVASTTIVGGRIHYAYGGSNQLGNISMMALSAYQESGTCDLNYDIAYNAGKNAEIDGEARITLDCVTEGGIVYGGATNADMNSNVTLNITNGSYTKIFGGNNQGGKLNGSITINIQEQGCKPIHIDELYGGGNEANYSIYGYNSDNSPRTKEQYETALETALSGVDEEDATAVATALATAGLAGLPYRNPHIMVVSATSIGTIYGGAYKANVIGSPHINVNMEKGKILAKYVTKSPSDFTVATHSDDKGGYTVESLREITKEDGTKENEAILALGYIGNIFGGGNEGHIDGDTHIEIGTGTQHNNVEIEVPIEPARNAATITGDVYGGGNNGNISGNTYVAISGANVGESGEVKGSVTVGGCVFGGGNMGSVGTFTYTSGKPTGYTPIYDDPLSENKKEIGPGISTVIINGYAEIGPDDMKMTSAGGPDDNGHVFGAGRGTVDLYWDTNMSDEEKQAAIAALDEDGIAEKIAAVDKLAYVNKTNVTIGGHAFVKGSVYGGGFDGHVLNDTHVIIEDDCQIGNGWDTTLNSGAGGGVNRRYTDKYAADVWTNRTTYPSLPECASWPYTSPYKAHDKFANATGDLDKYSDNTTPATGRRQASDGHTFYGNVFGGGSGYYPAAPGLWVHKAGWVEGNTLVEIKGGHVLTSIYGGNEMTNVGTGLSGAGGKCTVRMSGGTLGVPRTLTQIAAHPVTCYLFGAGKGDQNFLFNRETNVKEVEVEVTGGTIFGSVFGGGEDGHVLGDVKMTIGNDDGTGPTIGTWGTSYVDGNIFGGGRGFSGESLTAGNVGGSIKMDIKGGTMLGSIYGGGRLGSVGYGLYNTTMADPENPSETIPNPNYGKMLDDNVDEFGTTTTYYTSTGMNKKGRGHIDINITGGTIGNSHEYIIPQASNIPTGLAADFTTWSDDDWTTWQNHNNVPNTDYDTSNGRVTHTKGGNVFAGAMGRRTALNGSTISNWKQLGNAKSTKLTISGANTWIMGNVYGGGEFGAVTGNHATKDTQNADINTGTEIIINGGTIGTEVTGSTPEKETITTTPSGVQYTFGSVYGGGYGTEAEINDITENAHVNKLGALVADNTYINMTTGLVRASVYGGGEIAAVGGNSNVNISGGKIGRNEVYSKTEPYKGGAPNPGYVKFGSSTMGNVFGGGKGTSSHTLVGVVKGNTTINISAGDGVPTGEPFIYHNVYGGGAYSSVGTFNFSDGTTGDMASIPKGIPFNWVANTGVATVNIKGGTIGISGRDNGMVNGSSRGDIAKPVPTVMFAIPVIHSIDKDPYDKMAWVEQSIVNIGETGEAGPHIKGSVYGGGENGHVFTHATVNMKSGTIGIVDEEDPWYDFGNTSINEAAWVTRGNVYGAGCGTDTYWDDKNSNGVVDDGEEHYNAWAGCVIGNTDVNISGGLIAQSVYGGGSMGSVGRLLEGADVVKHEDVTNGFALSWPVKFVYKDLTVQDPVEKTHSTGKATVRITGGRIGTTGSDNGDVFGGTRGMAGDRYELAEFGNVRETEVIVDFTPPSTDAINPIEDGGKYKLRIDLKDGSDNFVNAIAGSIYGGCENGHVNENTKVEVRNGLIGHAIYGGGKGKGTYIPSGGTKAVPSITAGKVYGNTQVTMSNGYVLRNIYGGGNLGSVGKGNYAGGSDDYASGYGEKITGNLWTTAFDSETPESELNPKDNAWYFMNSGKATVNVLGGTIGLLPTSAAQLAAFEKDKLPTGNVFGACRGQAAAEMPSLVFDETSPDFFFGYVNETDVNIGGYRCKTEYTISETTYKVGDCITAEQYADLTSGKDNWDLIGPTIRGSVYGGGQDGHVRRDTKVNIFRGEIGVPYTDNYRTNFGTINKTLTEELDNLHWLHRGNVYGGGSGIGKYEYKYTEDEEEKTGEANSSSAGSVTRNTNVNIMGGTVHRNVYGGGSLASVVAPSIAMALATPGTSLTDAVHGKQSFNTLNIAGTIGTPDDFITDFKYNKVYGGEVYGASRGEKNLSPDYFGLSVWTLVNIKNGAHIMGNVFGGGDAGKVLKDSKVVVGAE